MKEKMRNFSDFEKKIILRMIDLDEKSRSLNVLGNIYGSFSKELSLPDYCYVDVKSESDVKIQVKNSVLNSGSLDLNYFDDTVSKMMLTVVMLFEHLEDESLAYFIGDLDFCSVGTVCSDEEYTPCDFLENESKALIYKYTRKKIFISESLKVLAKNEFKSEEVIRHESSQAAIKKQLAYTQIALGLTFVGLLVSVFLPMFSVSDINIKNTKLNTALDNSTLDAISRDSNVILAQIKDTCSGIVILATIYIQTCIKPSGAFLCLSFIKNVH
ncbi:hypothetical protein [Pseudoalteromonas distincta]|uniref:hypothetical protein n=1 Tax=Pseudoalteromonas distincta TaxID=77608 RepID=UPI000C1F9A34|nr:hypothetical protein [Pseudoalteromonas distincta]